MQLDDWVLCTIYHNGKSLRGSLSHQSDIENELMTMSNFTNNNNGDYVQEEPASSTDNQVPSEFTTNNIGGSQEIITGVPDQFTHVTPDNSSHIHNYQISDTFEDDLMYFPYGPQNFNSDHRSPTSHLPQFPSSDKSNQ